MPRKKFERPFRGMRHALWVESKHESSKEKRHDTKEERDLFARSDYLSGLP